MRHPVRISFVLVFLALVVPVAQAGVLYKCSGVNKALTIQSEPCPAGSTQVWKRDSAPAPQPTLQQVVANQVQSQGNAGTVHGAAPPVGAVWETPAAAPAASAPPAPIPPTAPEAAPAAEPLSESAMAVAPAPLVAPMEPALRLTQPTMAPAVNSACDAAKNFAGSVREKIWLELTQEQQQRLYGWVMNQCDSQP